MTFLSRAFESLRYSSVHLVLARPRIQWMCNLPLTNSSSAS